MEKRFIAFSFVIILFALCIPRVYATSSSTVIEEKAFGYEYVWTKENGVSTWGIGYGGEITTIIENEENKRYVEAFKRAVGEINTNFFTLLVISLWTVGSVLAAFIIYKKNKKLWEKERRAFVISGALSLILAFTAYSSLDRSLNTAKHYYYGLMSEKYIDR